MYCSKFDGLHTVSIPIRASVLAADGTRVHEPSSAEMTTAGTLSYLHDDRPNEACERNGARHGAIRDR